MSTPLLAASPHIHHFRNGCSFASKILMNDFRQILFPVDFSDRCIATVPFVMQMVQQFGSALTLINVVEFPMNWYGTVPGETAGGWDVFPVLLDKAREQLGAFRRTYLHNIPSAQVICELGNPADATLAHAAKIGVDLIMMPTLGDSPFRAFLLGSVTARVLHRASCAVWTGAHLETAPMPERSHVKNILCALDLEKDVSHVLKSAADLGRNLSATVRLVHCVPAPESGPTAQFNSEFEQFLETSARDRISDLQARLNTAYHVSLAGGTIANVVRDAALTDNTDLIVIGRGHVQAPLARLRTHAHAIIRQAPCPVMSML